MQDRQDRLAGRLAELLTPASSAQPKQAAGGDTPGAPTWGDVGMGWTMAVELLTATLVWGGIGWLADRFLGTAPWLMCAGFVIGNLAGIYLCWLRTQRAEDGTTQRSADRPLSPAEGRPGDLD